MEYDWDDDERGTSSVRVCTRPTQINNDYVPLVSKEFNMFKSLDEKQINYDEIEYVEYAFERRAPILEEIEDDEQDAPVIAEETEQEGGPEEAGACYDLITKNKFMYT
jgi:hypothetical protein